MQIIKVTANVRPAAVAGAIAGIIREGQTVEVRAIGPSAVNQMVKAVITARKYLQDEGVTTSCEPSFVELDIDGVERTAIRFTISVVGAASVPDS